MKSSRRSRTFDAARSFGKTNRHNAAEKSKARPLSGQMSNILIQPCDEGVIRSRPAAKPCARAAEPWILAATILGSSMAFIDGTVVNVALPSLQQNLNATVVDAQ